MPFSDFHGNTDVVTRLREMVQRGRLPHAIILSGPRGAGKYKLAQMVAKLVNCLSPRVTEGLPDFCGECANYRRISEADDLDTACSNAIKVRDEMTAAEQKDTRLLIQTHPDVLVIPPDPPQMMIKVGQVRRVIDTIYYRPGEARERIYIFTDSAFMKEAANSLLKVLEEPPEFATIFLLTENPGELLPTIRSRSMTLTLGALATRDIEDYLAAERRELAPKQRALVARLSGGAIGRARSFDLEGYIGARTDALTILSSAKATDHSSLFRTTETYRAGADGKDKTEQLIHTLYLLLEDMLFAKSGTEDLVRNIDILGEVKRLAAGADFEWIAAASSGLGEVESGMRRNLLRSLSLDAFAAALER